MRWPHCLPSLDPRGTFNSSEYSFDNGFTSNWNGSTFTITAIPETSTYIAAIGLLSLIIWPSRRRLLKDAKSILGLRAPGQGPPDALTVRARGSSNTLSGVHWQVLL